VQRLAHNHRVIVGRSTSALDISGEGYWPLALGELAFAKLMPSQNAAKMPAIGATCRIIYRQQSFMRHFKFSDQITKVQIILALHSFSPHLAPFLFFNHCINGYRLSSLP
jgi:hypothetical protein